MTTKPWGDEPATPYTGMVYDVSGMPFPDPNPKKQYQGFTKLEDACIRLKVTNPHLHPDLNALILESRRLDYAGQAVAIDGIGVADCFEIASEMIAELEEK